MIKNLTNVKFLWHTIIDKYGREFFIDIMEDESIRLVPVTKENENKE